MTLNRRPRIGIDVTAAVAQGGGIGRYTRELVRALVRSHDQENRQEYDYHLFSSRQPQLSPVPDPLPDGDSVHLHRSPLDERWLYRLWYRLRLPLPVQWLTGRLDLFHSPDFVLPPVAGRVPTLLTVHDLSFMHFPDAFTAALVHYLQRVVPWSVARATHVLADSQATKDDLISLWNVEPGKITVLYGGVDESFRPMTEREQLAAAHGRYGLGGKPYILSVGTVQPRKNYRMLIRAFKSIAQAWPHNLVIAGGKGWLTEEILTEAERQGVGGRVIFTGFVQDADLPALYSGATLFVFPSLYEGFGLPLLEAMACGVPVISSNASSLPEVAGQAAVLLDPHDRAAWGRTIHDLLSDSTRRARLVAAGYLQARRFRWETAAKQLLDIYDRLLAASNRLKIT